MVNKESNYTIIWNLFNISSTSNLKTLSNKKKYSLMNICQYNIDNYKTEFIKLDNVPLNNNYFTNKFKSHFNIDKINKYTKIIPIYNENNIYYIGIFKYICEKNKKKNINQIVNSNIQNDLLYVKNLFIELNKSMKHKKANFIKGILKCNLNLYNLKNDIIILDFDDKYKKINLTTLLENIQNYFWYFEWNNFL